MQMQVLNFPQCQLKNRLHDNVLGDNTKLKLGFGYSTRVLLLWFLKMEHFEKG